MPLALINDQALLFAHVPKTGGSSIEQYMRERGKVGLVTGGIPEGMETTPQHMTWSASNMMMPKTFRDHAFAVLRDPVDRLASEFRMRILGSEQALGLNPLNWLSYFLTRFRGGTLHRVRLFRMTLLLDFDTWVFIVLAVNRFKPTLYDNHIRPQSDFVADDCHLFLFENGLEKVFAWIDEKCGTPAGDRSFHVRKGLDMQLVVSERTRRRIEAFYRSDMQLIQRVKLSETEIDTAGNATLQ